LSSPDSLSLFCLASAIVLAMNAGTRVVWHQRRRESFHYYRSVPFSRIWPLFGAVFCLFGVVGVFIDLMNLGRGPYVILAVSIVLSGLTAIIYLFIAVRLKAYFYIIVSALQVPFWIAFGYFEPIIVRRFRLQENAPEDGVRVAAIAMFVLVIVSYSLFIRFLRGEGRESVRIRNELDLAHGIQKTLVPPISLRTAQFELYGRSDPSDKVGGDLVDTVQLNDGRVVAYLADIAGHGLQAGILMGMLKTAARTVLLDANTEEPCQVLSSMMKRLNRVLPDVKEPQMYATFAGFQLRDGGSMEYALAAHPPALLYRGRSGVEQLSCEQFPLGLLSVDGFFSESTVMNSGDLLIAVTDGILEACNDLEEEFGLDRLQNLIAGHAKDPLPVLCDAILGTVRAFGKQTDDQTLLLIRKL
jgi:serine phosphatase RsbU (regulator of sigma subunit)